MLSTSTSKKSETLPTTFLVSRLSGDDDIWYHYISLFFVCFCCLFPFFPAPRPLAGCKDLPAGSEANLAGS